MQEAQRPQAIQSFKQFVREGVQKKNVPFSSLLLLRGGGVGGDVKELLGFFINHVFIGVFQYDSGPPKHALELRDYVKYMFSPSISTLYFMISVDPKTQP